MSSEFVLRKVLHLREAIKTQRFTNFWKAATAPVAPL